MTESDEYLESDEHLQCRKDEIFALSSIYDELQLDEDELSGSLIIPVELDNPILVIYKERDGKVRFLPGLEFKFSTGNGYPESEPPLIKLSCSWLSDERAENIKKELVQAVWESTKELCLFTMIDELSAMAKSLFGMEYLEVDEETLFDEITQFAKVQELAQFQQHSYYCSVCLENKKGVDCYKLPRCSHVFCKVSLL